MNPSNRPTMTPVHSDTTASTLLQQQQQEHQNYRDQKQALMALDFFHSLQHQCIKQIESDSMPVSESGGDAGGGGMASETSSATTSHNVQHPLRYSAVVAESSGKVADGQTGQGQQVAPQKQTSPTLLTPPPQFRDPNSKGNQFSFPVDVMHLMAQAQKSRAPEIAQQWTNLRCPPGFNPSNFADNLSKQIPLQSPTTESTTSKTEFSKQHGSSGNLHPGTSGTERKRSDNMGRRSRSNSGYRSSEGQMMRSFDHTVPPPAPPTSLFDEKGNFKISRMDVLSEEIWAFHNQTTQTDTILNRKLYLRDLLYYVICPIFPMCGLYVVGSSLNGFGNNNSDMDLCLMITNQELDQRNDAIVVLNLVFSELEKIEWISKQHLIFAKVPILRIEFESPYSDIIVDLNVNNSVAIKNTHLLCYYSSFDWRVRPLVTIVKEWAKKKGINDANQSSFTSYSLVLMVIHYLQCGVEPRLLPSLQKIFAKRFQRNADIRTLNATQPLPTIEGWVYNEKMTLGELLIGFLDYYANRFDYDRDAISIYEGERIDRAAVAKVPRNGVGAGRFGSHWRSQWRCICIEEPFTHLNTAHSIYDEMVFEEIKNAFRESHDELNSTRDLRKWLTNCKAITACPPKVGQFSH